MTANWCEAAGAALRYRIDGAEGPLLILVHEMGGMIESWDRVVPLLADRFRILRLDLRGAGMSEKIREGIRVEQLADDIAALLDVVGLRERAIIAGCAVGAAVSLTFAVRHAERCAGLVMMNPAISVTPENLPGLLARAERLREKGMRGIMDESLATGYPEAMRALNPDHFALFRNRWLANDPESLRAQFLMLAGMDLRKELAKVTCPVLAISGRHDRLRPTSYVNELLQVVADARLSVVDAGHHMPDQAPEAVAAEILAFARDLTDRRTGAVA